MNWKAVAVVLLGILAGALFVGGAMFLVEMLVPIPVPEP